MGWMKGVPFSQTRTGPIWSPALRLRDGGESAGCLPLSRECLQLILCLWGGVNLLRPACDCCGKRIAARFGVAVALLGFIAASADATDGVEPIGVSMQSRARGGADVAVGDSALSQIDNPASLALSPRDACRFDVAGKIGILDVTWRSPVDTSDSERKIIPLINLGFTKPINDRLTFGVAVNSKAGLGTLFCLRHTMIPFGDRREDSDMKVISVPLSLGYKVTDRLSVGVGGRFEVATSAFSTVLGPADIEFGRGYAYGGGFNLGLHYRARDDLAFGLAYRSPTWFGDLSGGQARGSLFGLLKVPLGDASLEDMQLPGRIAGGVAWDVTKWFKLIGEVRWLNYSNSTFHNTTIGMNGVVDLRYPFPLGYHDQWAFIIGSEFKLDDHWKLGLGYHYATPAVDESNVTQIGAITATNHVTVGLRYEAKKWWAGAGYVLALPETLDADRHSHILMGTDYCGGSLTQTQHCISIGFGFNW
jgi:long-subunit fatty acid transport protein